jgi:hypothetical protein
MMQFFGSLFFPHLGMDQQKQRMNVVLLTTLATLFGGGIVGGAIFLLNTHFIRR